MEQFYALPLLFIGRFLSAYTDWCSKNEVAIFSNKQELDQMKRDADDGETSDNEKNWSIIKIEP